jgi:hypothetical protein
MFKYLFSCLMFLSIETHGQVGIKVVNTWPQNRIAEASSSNKLFPALIGVGVDYWFRLRKYRLEFLPALHVQYAHESIIINNEKVGKLNWTVFEFVPVLQFYPFDFKNDCMCPTFSKQGQFFKKGFFINIAPGIAQSNLSNVSQLDVNQQPLKSSQWIPFIRGGMGIDIGVSDLLTLSPAINYQLAQSVDWSAIFSSTSSNDINIYTGLFLSARLGWRFDRKNY